MKGLSLGDLGGVDSGYYFYMEGGKLHVGSDVTFTACSLDKRVVFCYMKGDSELDYHPRNSVFKSGRSVVHADDASLIKMYGSIESGDDIAILASKVWVQVCGGTVKAGGDFVIMADDLLIEEATIENTRDYLSHLSPDPCGFREDAVRWAAR